MTQGFSAVEAIVALVVIGLLVTLGYSRYNYHVAKSRQAEAKSNLIHIAALQEAYLLEYNQYYALKPVGLRMNGSGYACDADITLKAGKEMLNELGFRPRNCRELRYQYWTAPGFLGKEDDNPPKFQMRADSNPANTSVYIWPDCTVRDLWRIYHYSTLPEQGLISRRVLENCK